MFLLLLFSFLLSTQNDGIRCYSNGDFSICFTDSILKYSIKANDAFATYFIGTLNYKLMKSKKIKLKQSKFLNINSAKVDSFENKNSNIKLFFLNHNLDPISGLNVKIRKDKLKSEILYKISNLNGEIELYPEYSGNLLIEAETVGYYYSGNLFVNSIYNYSFKSNLVIPISISKKKNFFSLKLINQDLLLTYNKIEYTLPHVKDYSSIEKYFNF